MKSPLPQLLTALILCAIVIAGYGVWYGTIARMSTAVATIENQIAIKTETENRIASARAELAEVAGDESIVQSYFVSEASIVPFINYLEARGEVEKATVNVVSVSNGTDKTHPTLLLALTVKGTFDAVMRTVGTIEYAPYDLSIKKLLVAHVDKGAWQADLTLVVGSVPTASSSAKKTP